MPTIDTELQHVTDELDELRQKRLRNMNDRQRQRFADLLGRRMKLLSGIASRSAEHTEPTKENGDE